jgi:hypothetical protein
MGTHPMRPRTIVEKKTNPAAFLLAESLAVSLIQNMGKYITWKIKEPRDSCQGSVNTIATRKVNHRSRAPSAINFISAYGYTVR